MITDMGPAADYGRGQHVRSYIFYISLVDSYIPKDIQLLQHI